MEQLNQYLHTLQGQVIRWDRLHDQLEEHYLEREELEKRVEALRKEDQREQAEVDALERRGLKAAFYRFLGTIDEKLDKERRQASEAKRKLQEALNELDNLNFRISVLEEERKMLSGCQRRLEEALEEKKRQLRASGGPAAALLQSKEQEITEGKKRQKEIRQAIAAGKTAGRRIDSILSLLDEAEGWGVLDVAGGGFITDMVKHDTLDQAQRELDELQHDLEHFKQELADVTAVRELRVQIDGFLRFADYVFDGLFADWTVLDQITQSKNQVETIRNQVICVLDQLDSSLEQAQEQEQSLTQKLEDWLADA